MDLQEKLDFEATFLDGDNVEDCGGAMILASEVWEWHQNQIKQREATVRAEERNRIKKYMKDIIPSFETIDLNGKKYTRQKELLSILSGDNT